ncbi:hypothetical protein HPB50_015781 [Hyalomma asiaticum]|uniref:Uncharacterized protein n=1 Tax=Hyalomma asiaticum TaxID=266040 RepID=A0ACB7RWG8_HYAAI|nr:hypothetical protein HPB50_015781 [Hyalomma asiaticum]
MNCGHQRKHFSSCSRFPPGPKVRSRIGCSHLRSVAESRSKGQCFCHRWPATATLCPKKTSCGYFLQLNCVDRDTYGTPRAFQIDWTRRNLAQRILEAQHRTRPHKTASRPTRLGSAPQRMDMGEWLLRRRLLQTIPHGRRPVEVPSTPLLSPRCVRAKTCLHLLRLGPLPFCRPGSKRVACSYYCAYVPSSKHVLRMTTSVSPPLSTAFGGGAIVVPCTSDGHLVPKEMRNVAERGGPR